MTPDPMRLGHVPEWNLIKYRQLARLASRLDSLGDEIGQNDMEDSTTLWRLAAKYRAKANELRATIPEES